MITAILKKIRQQSQQRTQHITCVLWAALHTVTISYFLVKYILQTDVAFGHNLLLDTVHKRPNTFCWPVETSRVGSGAMNMA